jgi:hypothetical protein
MAFLEMEGPRSFFGQIQGKSRTCSRITLRIPTKTSGNEQRQRSLELFVYFWFKPKSKIGLAEKPSKAIEKIFRTG